MTHKGTDYFFEDLTPQQVEFLKSSGFPTFDQFQKDPDKYRSTGLDLFEMIENGPEVLRNVTKGRHVLSVVGKKVSSLGQMIRVAKDMGFDLSKMTCSINLEAVGNGKYVHHVDLKPKRDFQGEGEEQGSK